MYISGNGLVIYLYMKEKALKSASNLLIVNLACSDFLMLLTNFPVFTYNCFAGGFWMFSGFYCEVYAFCGKNSSTILFYLLVFCQSFIYWRNLLVLHLTILCFVKEIMVITNRVPGSILSKYLLSYIFL